MEAVIDLLLSMGFAPDGLTRQETVRVPTVSSPLYGKGGGELATFGGRRRFKHPSGWQATVGKITTCVYKRDGAGFSAFHHLSTKEADQIRSLLSNIQELK